MRCSTSEAEIASSVGAISALMRNEPIGYESTSRGMTLSSRLYMTKCRVASGSTPSRHTWKLARMRKFILGDRKTSIGGSDSSSSWCVTASARSDSSSSTFSFSSDSYCSGKTRAISGTPPGERSSSR